MQLSFIQVAFFFLSFLKLYFLNIDLKLCSQANGNTQVSLMNINWEFDGPEHKRIFSKLIFAATFATCYNHNHQIFRNNMQGVCDN